MLPCPQPLCPAEPRSQIFSHDSNTSFFRRESDPRSGCGTQSLSSHGSEPTTSARVAHRTRHTASGMKNVKGKDGKTYDNYGAFCLETQHFPDSPPQLHLPSSVFRVGSTYATTMTFEVAAAEPHPTAVERPARFTRNERRRTKRSRPGPFCLAYLPLCCQNVLWRNARNEAATKASRPGVGRTHTVRLQRGEVRMSEMLAKW
jgi:hypothetical protein